MKVSLRQARTPRLHLVPFSLGPAGTSSPPSPVRPVSFFFLCFVTISPLVVSSPTADGEGEKVEKVIVSGVFSDLVKFEYAAPFQKCRT